MLGNQFKRSNKVFLNSIRFSKFQTFSSTSSKTISESNYKGFGSFHNENVEELIKNPDFKVSLPFETSCQVDFSEIKKLSFGKEFREYRNEKGKPLFAIDFDNWLFLNQGFYFLYL